MGRKKKNSGSTVVELHTHNPTDPMTDDESEEFEAADALEDGELSRAAEEVAKTAGATAEVVKLADGKQLYCRSYAIADYSADRLAADYGAGTYRIRFKGPNKSYLKGGGTIDIAATLNPTPDPRVAGGGSGVNEVLAILKAERERSQAQWWDIGKIVAPLAIPKLLELFAGNKGPSLTELMAVISGAKEFHKPAPQMTMEQQLSQLVKVLEVAQNIGGNARDTTGATWVDLIRDAINQVPAVVGQIRGGIPMTGPLLPAPSLPASNGAPMLPHSAPVPNAAPFTPTPATPLPGNPPGGAGEMDLRMLPWLRATLEQLLVQAAHDRDPDLYAQVTLDNLPNYVDATTLVRFLERPDWWALVQQVDARVAHYVGWFEAYREMLLALLAQVRPPAPPPQPAAPLSQEEEFS